MGHQDHPRTRSVALSSATLLEPVVEWSQTGERRTELRNFWYATLPVDKIKDGPKPFRLLGEDIVLFFGERGALAALEDRCCHRTARRRASAKFRAEQKTASGASRRSTLD